MDSPPCEHREHVLVRTVVNDGLRGSVHGAFDCLTSSPIHVDDGIVVGVVVLDSNVVVVVFVVVDLSSSFVLAPFWSLLVLALETAPPFVNSVFSWQKC